MTDAPTREAGRIWRGWTLVVLLAGGVLRLARLDLHDYWVDEAISVWQASTPNVASSMVADGAHTPVFVGVLSLWIEPGAPVWKARLLCAATALATLFALVRLARRHFGAGAGRAMAWIGGFSSLLVYYGQEVRPYTLVLLLSTLLLDAALDLARAPSGRPWRWLLYLAWGSLLLWTHYFGLVFIGCCFLGGLAFRDLRFRALPWACVHVAIGLTFLPWLPAALTGFSKFRGIDMIGRYYSWPLDLGVPFVCFTVGKSIVPESLSPRLDVETAAILAGVLGGLVLGVEGLRRLRRLGDGTLLAWLLVLGLPVLALVVASRLHLTQYNWSRFRYVIFSCPPLLLLYAIGFSSLVEARRVRVALAAGLLLLGANALSLGNYFFNPQYLRAPAYREAAAWLSQRRAAGEPVVAAHVWAFVPMWVQLPAPMPLHMMGDSREEFGPSRYVAAPEDLSIPHGETFWIADYVDWRPRSPGYRSKRPPAWGDDRCPLVEEKAFRGIVLERRRWK